MTEVIKFEKASFRVSKFGKMTESEFMDFHKDVDMFNTSGSKKDLLLREAYRVIRSEYEKANPTKAEVEVKVDEEVKKAPLKKTK